MADSVAGGTSEYDGAKPRSEAAGAMRGPLSARSREGRIGFQAHLTGAPVEFRNVRIRSLAAHIIAGERFE